MAASRTALILAIGVLPFALATGGCSSSGAAGAGDASVVSAHPGAADQLEFFDTLEARPRVSYDDAIHAALLLEQEDSQTDYNRRVAVARQNGLVPGDFDRSAHSAITTGEAADLVMRAMVSRAGGVGAGSAGESTPATAAAQFKEAGVLSSSAALRDPISGRDFVSLLTGAREMIGLSPAREPTVLAEGSPKASTPTTPPAPATPAAESFDEPVAQAAPADAPATRELSSLPQPKPSNEPLVPPSSTPPPAATPTPTPKPTPAAATPAPKPAPVAEAPPAKPASGKRWVPGKPVKAPPPAPAPKSGG